MRTSFKNGTDTALSASLQAMRAAVLDRRTFIEVYLEGAIRKVVDLAARTAVLTHIRLRDDGCDIFVSRHIKTTRGAFSNKQCLVFSAENNGLVFGNSKMFLEIRHGRISTFLAWIDLYRKVPGSPRWEKYCPQTLVKVSGLLRSLPFVNHDGGHVLIGIPEYMHGHC